MKNFNDDCKRGSKKFSGPKSFHNESRPQGRFDKGRAPRAERDDSKPELFKTTCTTCGKPCEVPFKPDGIKPVLCRDCFSAKNGPPFTPKLRSNDRDQGTTKFRPDTSKSPADYVAFEPSKDANYKALKEQIGALESKINRLVDLMSPTELDTRIPTHISLADETETTTPKRKPKLTTPAVKKAAAKKKVQTTKKVAKKLAQSK
jgi:CxxC-x17-CxxC domain-containing protein